MSDVEILYVCDGSEKCSFNECHHKKPHTHIAGCESNCQGNHGGVLSAKCAAGQIVFKMDKTKAQELINVISMAAGEGVEYEFTDDMAVKLGKFINGVFEVWVNGQ